MKIIKPAYRIHYSRQKSWCLSYSSGVLIAAYFGSVAEVISHIETLSKLRAI